MYRFWRTHEDADEDGYFVQPVADWRPWHCEHCGQLNDPAHHGGEWPTCVMCGHKREDFDAPPV